MEFLRSTKDFEWYKTSLDAKAKHHHNHYGKPEKFPCKVESEWEYCENGSDIYNHRFVYQQDVVCESCGHKTIVWPDETT